MKTNEEIKQILLTRIQEHTKIMSEINRDFEALQAGLAKLKTDPTAKHKLVMESSKVLVMRDLHTFHKASLLVLNDLLKEIE